MRNTVCKRLRKEVYQDGSKRNTGASFVKSITKGKVSYVLSADSKRVEYKALKIMYKDKKGGK